MTTRLSGDDVVESEAAHRFDFEGHPLVHRVGAEQLVEFLGRRFRNANVTDGAALPEPRQGIGRHQQVALLAARIVQRRAHRVQAIEIDRPGIGVVARLGRELVAAHSHAVAGLRRRSKGQPTAPA